MVQNRGPVAESVENGDEPLGYVNGREFLDYLNDY
jgi:hypothetical protein